MSFCGLIKGISPKICILCVRVKINKRLFGSCFRTLVVILFQIIFQFIAELTRRPNRGEGRERASERASERERERERERRTTVQACPKTKQKEKLLFKIFAHEGFVKACPVGWIPTIYDEQASWAKIWNNSLCRTRTCLDCCSTFSILL